MGKINYTNKTTLNPQPSIADENKVTSGDMNEIKSVVNGNFTNNSVTVGDTTPTGDNITATWIKASGNIFDSSNANILNALLRTSDNTLYASSSERSLYVECKPNTTYRITKTAGARFRVDERASTPTIGSANINMVMIDTASQLTYTTSANGNYLVVNYFTTSESGTEQDMLNSISIEVVSSINILNNSTYNEIYKQEVYSLNEIKTNKIWIDGKPIYRKIFEGTANIQQSGSSQPITNLPSDSETIINLYGYFKWSSYLQTFPIVWGTSSCSLRVVGKSIQYFSNFGIGTGTYIIISEYTKTTD